MNHGTSRTIALLAALSLAPLAGCGSKTEGATGSSSSNAGAGNAGAGAKPAKKEVKLEMKNLDKLGVKIEVPSDTQVMDGAGDAPGVAMFNDAGDFSVDVATVTAVYASSADAAKEEIKKDPNKFKKFTVEKVTADGWHFEFELESMMDKKPLYGVQVRKKIGDKELECSRNQPSEASRAAAAKACDSIVKL